MERAAKQHVIEKLYAITPDETDTVVLINKVRLALQGGAQILQYRNKTADAALKREQAHALRRLTREFDRTFIVNDDPLLAVQVEADGVHLGGEDGEISAARALLGRTGIIGVSCYNRAPLAFEAMRLGADYVAFGAFFPSAVKPGAARAELSLLQAARREINVPIVAIGGITPQNGAVLVEAGADALAVISALWDAPDIMQVARDFANLFSKAAS